MVQSELEKRVESLARWGEALVGQVGGGASPNFSSAKELAFHKNGWFDARSIDETLQGIAHLLEPTALKEWANTYPQPTASKTVGIIMAGNLPLVGMHDLVCVLTFGHKALVKLSSDDDVLLPAGLELMGNISPDLADQVTVVHGSLPKTDAVLATGSNNTSRYFEHYFKDRAALLRKGRNGLAVLDGSETEEELSALGKDIFVFYGLGCRSISKVLLPEDFDVQRLFQAFFPFEKVIENKKYANNYNYNRTIYLMNEDDFLDNGFLMLKEDAALASPVATLHYQRYGNEDELLDLIKGHEGQIQCIVGHGNVPFGKSQLPGLYDYADGLDTMEFLTEL